MNNKQQNAWPLTSRKPCSAGYRLLALLAEVTSGILPHGTAAKRLKHACEGLLVCSDEILFGGFRPGRNAAAPLSRQLFWKANAGPNRADLEALLDHDWPVAEQAILTGQPLQLGLDESSHVPGACLPPLRSALALPVNDGKGETIGCILLYARAPATFSDIGEDLFAAFGTVLGASLECGMRLRRIATESRTDLLTGALNRHGFQECAQTALSHGIQRERSLSLLMFDLDRFRLVNERMGHENGDVALEQVVGMARRELGSETCLGRWSGGVFACILSGRDPESAVAISERLRRRIAETPLKSDGGTLNVTASVGIASYPEDGGSLSSLCGAAEAALYQAKRDGRNRSVIANNVRKELYSMGSVLDSALEDGRVLPAYQPIVELGSSKIVGLEALARLITPGGDVLQAGQFIEAAELLQLSHRVDDAIISQAFADCAAAMHRGEQPLDRFINLSADLLRHPERVERLLDDARAQCMLHGVERKPRPVVIEITERELLADIENAHEMLRPMLDFGFRLALDDFGSGYSSYHYLADLPISVIKVDGRLIQRIAEPKVRAIVQGIQDTASSLNIRTVAEFVEDADTEKTLLDVGIDMAQGYHYSWPKLNQAASPLQH